MLGNLNTPYKTRAESQQLKTDTGMQNRDFKAWTGDNMYRTSYRDMSKKVSYYSVAAEAEEGCEARLPRVYSRRSAG